MGMSASQARLLSITGRLTNNEFRAQVITNDKLRLASEITQATKAYNEALDSEQLMFMNYADNGDATKVSLTHALINEYAPLKNQYILRNPGNKVLISNIDAKNFTETKNLYEFLDRYGLVEDKEYYTKKVISDNPKWFDWKNEHDDWKAREPQPPIYIEGEKSRVYDDSRVYDAVREKVSLCFGITINGNKRCYMHVFNALIGFGEHTTSDGHTFTSYCADSGSGDPALDLNHLTGVKDGYTFAGGWGWNSCESDEYIGDELRDLLKSDSVASETCDGTTKTRYEGRDVPCRGDGSDATQYNAPLVINPDGTRTGGNCYQKAVDLLWKLHTNYQNGTDTGGAATIQELEEFYYFIEYDLGEWHEETSEGHWEDRYGYQEWKDSEPKEPEKNTIVYEKYLSDIVVNDQDKAQWYTNLWHILNDSKTANTVDWKQLKTSWDSDVAEYGYKVSNKEKTVQQDMFEVLDTNLSESPEWLQFALEHGVVSMERATFRDPSIDSEKILEKTPVGFTWKSIIYTEATDIVSVPDDNAVTRAEVEHKKALKKIRAEEKKLDTDLKKLDTEHSALQAEYDAIKETISKNVQRSFKMFS